LFLLVALLLSCAGAPRPPSDSKQPDQIQWEPIRSWSGRDSHHLDSFPSEGTLRIEWEARRLAGARNPAAFSIVMHSAISGRPLAAPVVDHQGGGKGTAYVSEEPRVFFLNVTSEGVEWRVTVAERVR
jgi:hypothetical protein